MRIHRTWQWPPWVAVLLLLSCSSGGISPAEDVPAPDLPEGDVILFVDQFGTKDTAGNGEPEDVWVFDFGPVDLGQEVAEPAEVVQPPEEVVEPVDVAPDVAESEPLSEPFQAFTAGGSSLESPSYRLHLYLAPVRPVGSTASPKYRLTLGPASFWRQP